MQRQLTNTPRITSCQHSGCIWTASVPAGAHAVPAAFVNSGGLQAVTAKTQKRSPNAPPYPHGQQPDLQRLQSQLLLSRQEGVALARRWLHG